MTDRCAARPSPPGCSGGYELLDTVLDQGRDDDPVVLDAALDAFLIFGIRRTPMHEIACRAGFGLATLYRRYPGKRAIVEAVIYREARQFCGRVDAEIDPTASAAAQLADRFATAVRILATHPLLTRLLVTEPDAVHHRAFGDSGELLALGRAACAHTIRRLQRCGDLPGVDAELTAELLTRLALTFILRPGGVVPVTDDAALRRFAHQHVLGLVLRT